MLHSTAGSGSQCTAEVCRHEWGQARHLYIQYKASMGITQHSTKQHKGMAQHSTAQHSTAQHSTAQHSTAQHSTAQHSTAQHSTAQHSTAQHSTAQHSTAQHSTAQHSTAQRSTTSVCCSTAHGRAEVLGTCGISPSTGETASGCEVCALL